jgi:hypothetical protein
MVLTLFFEDKLKITLSGMFCHLVDGIFEFPILKVATERNTKLSNRMIAASFLSILYPPPSHNIGAIYPSTSSLFYLSAHFIPNVNTLHVSVLVIRNVVNCNLFLFRALAIDPWKKMSPTSPKAMYDSSSTLVVLDPT